MAAATREAVAETAIASNAQVHTVSLPTPAGGILADDLVVIVGTGDSRPFEVAAWPAGFLELAQRECGTVGSGTAQHFVAWQRMAGGESGTVDITTADIGTSGGGSDHATWQLLCIRGAHVTQAPEVATAQGNSTNANPPSLTASWGAEENLWIATMGTDGTVVATAAPANFAGLDTLAGDSSGASTSHATRAFTGATLDPGTFTSSTEQWAATTIVIRPAAAGGDVTAPVVQTTSATRTRLSRQAGVDSTDVTITAGEAFVEYQLRAVPATTSTRTEGTLIETATVTSRTSHTTTVTDDELVAAGLTGTILVKSFVRDTAGNWSANA
jgi:hypothetical protein